METPLKVRFSTMGSFTTIQSKKLQILSSLIQLPKAVTSSPLMIILSTQGVGALPHLERSPIARLSA